MDPNDKLDSQMSPDAEGKKTHNAAARGALAAGFAYVGAKVGTIGTIVDIDKAIGGGQSLTFKEKFIKVFDGSLKEMMREQVEGKTFVEGSKALSKTFKFSIYTTAIGMAAGAVLGWVRGDRIKKPTDLIIHPIKSLELALGPKPKDTETYTALAANDVPDKTRWTESVSQPQQTTEATLSR